MAGKPQKRPGQLQNKRGGRLERRGPELRPVVEGTRPIPPCPEGLHEKATGRWEGFWLSNAGAATPLEPYRAQLEDWISCVSEEYHTQEAIAKTPTVEGSMGQDTMNPLLAYLKHLRAKIREYEQDFGMSPLAAIRLNVADVQHKTSVLDLTARLERRRAAEPEAIEAEVIDLGDAG